jgi:hypothetical protein
VSRWAVGDGDGGEGGRGGIVRAGAIAAAAERGRQE